MRTLVCIDTETATLQGAPHLLELGAVRIEEGEIVDHFETLVCPAVPIDPGATEIHGITDRDVRSAPFAAEALAQFSEFVGNDWMAAHNAPFDTRVLGFEYKRAGLTPPPGMFLDSLPLARRYIPEAPDHKLITLCQMLDLEEGDHHRALADSVWCWKVLEACLERASSQGAAALDALLEHRGRPLTIASRAPAPARMSPRLRPLERALRDGETVQILYGENALGSRPIEVLPRLLYESHAKSYLEAEFLQGGDLRTYRLDRVHKVLPAGA
ncbi:MAG: exonuclease domain-containing protein [Planctomycetota bacterium]